MLSPSADVHDSTDEINTLKTMQNINGEALMACFDVESLYTNILYINILYTNIMYTNILYTNILYTNILYTNILYTNIPHQGDLRRSHGTLS